MAQFRVELVRDPASGKFRAELYHPDRPEQVLVRTEPLYPTQEAAVLGVVQLFKDAIPKRAARKPRKAAKGKKSKRSRSGKAGKQRR